MLDIERLSKHLTIEWLVESFSLSLHPVVEDVIAESPSPYDMVKWMNTIPIDAFFNFPPSM